MCSEAQYMQRVRQVHSQMIKTYAAGESTVSSCNSYASIGWSTSLLLGPKTADMIFRILLVHRDLMERTEAPAWDNNSYFLWIQLFKILFTSSYLCQSRFLNYNRHKVCTWLRYFKREDELLISKLKVSLCLELLRACHGYKSTVLPIASGTHPGVHKTN